MKAVAESCVVSSVHTNFLFNLYDLALHQSAGYFDKSQKRAAKYIQFFNASMRQKAAIRELQPLAQKYIAHACMRTQSHVCENPISSFVRSTSILVLTNFKTSTLTASIHEDHQPP